MKMDEMFQENNPGSDQVTEADKLNLWPQPRGELLGFALHLERRGATLTAAQLRLAVAMADCEYLQAFQRIFDLRAARRDSTGAGTVRHTAPV